MRLISETLIRKMRKAANNNDIQYLVAVKNNKLFQLLTTEQKNSIIELSEILQYNIYRKIEEGQLSPANMTHESCAVNSGLAYTCYIRRYLFPLFFVDRATAINEARIVYENIKQNTVITSKIRWDDCFLLMLGKGFDVYDKETTTIIIERMFRQGDSIKSRSRM